MNPFLVFPFSSHHPVKVTETEGKIVFERHDHPLVFAPAAGQCRAFVTKNVEPLRALAFWLEEPRLYLVMSGFIRLDGFIPKTNVPSEELIWEDLLLPVDAFTGAAKNFQLGSSLGAMNDTLNFSVYAVRDDKLELQTIAVRNLFQEDTDWHPKYAST